MAVSVNCITSHMLASSTMCCIYPSSLTSPTVQYINILSNILLHVTSYHVYWHSHHTLMSSFVIHMLMYVLVYMGLSRLAGIYVLMSSFPVHPHYLSFNVNHYHQRSTYIFTHSLKPPKLSPLPSPDVSALPLSHSRRAYDHSDTPSIIKAHTYT